VSTLTDTVSFCATALSLSREAGQRHHDLSLSLLSQVNTMGVQQDFRDLIELFNKHRIDYVVVGSCALGFHGAPLALGATAWVALVTRGSHRTTWRKHRTRQFPMESVHHNGKGEPAYLGPLRPCPCQVERRRVMAAGAEHRCGIDEIGRLAGIVEDQNVPLCLDFQINVIGPRNRGVRC
jgi:hypothetical protein